MNKNKYGLFTAIGMIVGVVIGSGIFFKSDNILIATGGSISLGVLVFAIAAIGIIFGSLTISELASRNSKAGGIITYAEESYNKSIACSFGWFHTLLYYPTLISVVSWVVGIYICMLFGVKGNLEIQVLIGTSITGILFIFNILSSRLGAYFQNASTIIKLIPLILIAFVGIAYGDPKSIVPSDVTSMHSLGWLSAITPIAFSFDGWIVATSIGHEIKDPKKNLPKALIIAPLFILVMYIAYFVGISTFIGPEMVINLGDAHVDMAANKILGPMGAKIFIVFVIISIMGTVNGLLMGLIRLPYSLAIRGMFPKSHKISKINKDGEIPLNSALVALFLIFFWILINYLTQKYSILPNSDISEISITINYVLYIFLYLKVFNMGRSGEVKGVWRGFLNPILAILGSLIILIGSMNNPLFLLYTSFCLALLISAVLFWKSKERKLNLT